MNTDSRLRIREAKRRRARQIDLSALELMAVPGELFELVWLQSLNLSGNCISRLDERLGGLAELRELDLTGNLLEALPRCLGLLPRLEQLNVSRNPLRPELLFLAADGEFAKHRAQFLAGFEAGDALFHRELSPAVSASPSAAARIPAELQTAREDVELGGQIAQGGFAVVHRARFFGAEAAVKLFAGGRTPATEADFRAELGALGALRHPAVVALLGFGTAPDRFLLLELIEGPSLHQALHVRRQPLDKLRLLRALAAVLAFVHARQLVHRDLTPRNVLLSAQGQVKLIDFGLCRPPGQLEPQRGTVTPAYAAPELFGHGALCEKVDVWSFGVLLWEVVGERVPAAGLAPADVRRALLAGQFATQLGCAHLSSAATELVRRCLQTEPAARPSMQQLWAELERLDSI